MAESIVHRAARRKSAIGAAGRDRKSHAAGSIGRTGGTNGKYNRANGNKAGDRIRAAAGNGC